MQAWQYGLASPPPTEYNHYDVLDSSQSSDSDSDCSSSATLASAASSLSTLSSATSASVWSVPSSQHSDFTSFSVTGSEARYCDESRHASQQQQRLVPGRLLGESFPPELGFQQQQTQYQAPQAPEVIASELRKNPRRTSAAASAARGCPPTLFKQVDRKVEFVDKLVDSATYIVEAIWPTSSVPCRADFGTSSSVLPLRKFIEETLRRSRTSYSTLQVGLYYLILVKPHIPARDFTMEQTDESHASRALQCGRRMFLAALILASKWLQDRNYSARAWSKISGLNVSEINQNELAFLAAVDWELHLSEDLYKVWSDLVMDHTPSSMPPPPSPGGFERQCASFKKLIQGLTPELDNIHDLVPAKRVHDFVPRSTKTPLYSQPSVMEPQPSGWSRPGHQPSTLPALGLIPTPRSTPRPPLVSQSSYGFSTPAVCAASQFLGRTQSMSSAMSYASAVSASQTSDRWPAPVPTYTSFRTSPERYVPTRRSSLANTVSTPSSPESMVSDSSSLSRTSSVSLASLMHHAPAYMQARRAAGERQRMVYGQQYHLSQGSLDDALANKRKMSVAGIVDIPEHLALDEADVRFASPDSYSPSATDGPYQLSMREAAFALQELHNRRDADELTPKAPQTWSAHASQGPKRKRNVESDLQENVRGLLSVHPEERATMWPEDAAIVQPSPAKRLRRSATNLCQPHFDSDFYGQHHLIEAI